MKKTATGVELERAKPPVLPQANEVVVRVVCAGFCRTDLYLADGQIPCPVSRTLGHEGSGVICSVGSEVSQERLGQRVSLFPWLGCGVCRQCLEQEDRLGHACGQRQFLGQDFDGCFAEYCLVPQRLCIPLPDEVGFQAGAYLEPVLSALAVLRAPLKSAAKIGVLGQNRFASLLRFVIEEMAQCVVQNPSDLEEDSYDLLVETQADQESLALACRLMKRGGTLVVKSRPADSVPWPVKLQVEKELQTVGLNYGQLPLALLMLRTRSQDLGNFWAEPVKLEEWVQVFERERQGEETLKAFFGRRDF